MAVAMSHPNSPSLLKACDICRNYQVGGSNVPALDRISLQVASGDFLVITGPSGAGKSTLLYLLSGMERPSGGEVFFSGKSLKNCGEKELAEIRNSYFGFVFQTPHVLYDRTVLENVILPGRYALSEKPAAILARAKELLGYVGIEYLAERMPNTLSGGELQRMVFARSLVCNPQIIFADEPTGSLDQANSIKILELLQDQSAQNRAVIMVTHDPQAIPHGAKQLILKKAKNLACKIG